MNDTAAVERLTKNFSKFSTETAKSIPGVI
jgi:hypothetical protein